MSEPTIEVLRAENERYRRALADVRDVLRDAEGLLARMSDVLVREAHIPSDDLLPKIADLAAARARLRPHLAHPSRPPRRT